MSPDNEKYDWWNNFVNDLDWAEGRTDDEVIDAEAEDTPPALPSGEEK